MEGLEKTYKVVDLKKSYGELKVLDGINIDFKSGKVTAILGPSGSGKTTMFNILMDNIEDFSGEIIGFKDCSISSIFQEHRLIQWKSVYENIEFVLKDKIQKENLKGLIDKYLNLVGLKDYIDYYPKSLSGGMKQRVNIARAFAYPSEVLLMDEPFKSLDIRTKNDIYNLFRELMVNSKRAVILITHDIDEAVALGDTIVIFSDKPTKIKAVIENKKGHESSIKKQIEDIM